MLRHSAGQCGLPAATESSESPKRRTWNDSCSADRAPGATRSNSPPHQQHHWRIISMSDTKRNPVTHTQRTSIESAPTANSESQHGIKRVATASFIGTVIEFYDFGIYGTAAALVFPHVFFPALGPAAATVASFATFGVAFVARPFGSLLFGHFGDRLLFSSEHAPKSQRGFWGSFANLGGGGAIVLSNATFFLTAILVSDEDFVNWAWRVPFLASFLLVIVGLWIRLTIDESPVFTKEVERGGTSRMPFVEAFKHQSREIALAIGTLTMVMALVYVGGTYLVNYGTKELGLSRTYVLGMAMVGGMAVTVGCVIGALLGETRHYDLDRASATGNADQS
jgi:MFS family permease